MFGNTAMFLI